MSLNLNEPVNKIVADEVKKVFGPYLKALKRAAELLKQQEKKEEPEPPKEVIVNKVELIDPSKADGYVYIYDRTLESIEEEVMLKVFRKLNGSVMGTARVLEQSRATIYRRLSKAIEQLDTVPKAESAPSKDV